MNMNNIILSADSYKFSHYKQYPPKTTKVFAYIESRGGKYPANLFVGLQIFIKERLLRPITKEDVMEAKEYVTKHMGPDLFNEEGWMTIVNEFAGKLPVEIKAVPEGTLVPTGNVLVTIENTDPRFFWLVSFLETALLRAVWYPTTVATNSWSSKQVIKRYLEETGDPSLINFKLHDFGARGVSSSESAGIGGLAHLVNFMGTDTVEALVYAREYYGEDMAGFSIPASEHSTMTSWGGRNGEVVAMRNMLEQYAKPGALLACVSDSYDIFNAVENLWGGELKQEVIDSGATLVIRPDSGDPASVVLRVVTLIDKTFGSVVNDKGYKVLNNVRVIQGDGIVTESIAEILSVLKTAGYSADNVAFGQGGGLLQQVNRDTSKFAMKTSAAEIDGEWIDVFKDPITDSGKRSKKGRITLFRNSETGEFTTGRIGEGNNPYIEDVMVTVFKNGELMKDYTLSEVRANSNK